MKLKEVYKVYQNIKQSKEICRLCKSYIMCDVCKKFGKVEGKKLVKQSKID